MTYYVKGKVAVLLKPWVIEDLGKMLADVPRGGDDPWVWIGRATAWFGMLTEGRLDLYDIPTEIVEAILREKTP